MAIPIIDKNTARQNVLKDDFTPHVIEHNGVQFL